MPMSFGLCMRMRIRTRIEALRFLVGQRVGSKLPPTGRVGLPAHYLAWVHDALWVQHGFHAAHEV